MFSFFYVTHTLLQVYKYATLYTQYNKLQIVHGCICTLEIKGVDCSNIGGMPMSQIYVSVVIHRAKVVNFTLHFSAQKLNGMFLTFWPTWRCYLIFVQFFTKMSQGIHLLNKLFIISLSRISCYRH